MANDDLTDLERDLEARRRCISETGSIAFGAYERDVSRLLAVVRRLEERLDRLAERCRGNALRSRAKSRRLAREDDPVLRGRLLGQAAALEWVAAQLVQLSRGAARRTPESRGSVGCGSDTSA